METVFSKGECEPVNTVLKAVRRLALVNGDCVLVVEEGPIGLLFTQLLTAMRMKVIAIDLHEHRLKRVRDFRARVAASANDTKLSQRSNVSRAGADSTRQ
jgi:L-iditol 2-dehydrogenase